MKTTRRAVMALLVTITVSIFATNAAGSAPDSPPAQSAAATQANPQPLQVPTSAAGNPGAQKASRKRAQVKQGSAPPDIHALHPKSK